MKNYLAFAAAALFFCACSSSDPKSQKEALYIPTDMPDICQNVDFNMDKSMRETCGVKPARYQAYRNVPMQRYLINPNQASIVKNGDKIEIRFPNAHPVPLSEDQISGVNLAIQNALQKFKIQWITKNFTMKKKNAISYSKSQSHQMQIQK